MNILVAGLGFVGLTTALGFAEKGHNVFGFDTDKQKTVELMDGKLTISEPGLTEAISRHLNNNFKVLSALSDFTADIQAIFICVGTPCDANGQADLHYVFNSFGMLKNIIGSDIFNGVIVIKSTVPPSTTKTKIIPYLCEKGISVKVANNPEFLREGYCWDDFMNPDRIVCGAEDFSTENLLRDIYKKFNAPVVFTSLNTAEFIKYLSNNMLANMISFSNEMAMIAQAIGDISVKRAFEILQMDKRWADAPMKSYMYPGCGFGGYCLPKDLQAMIAHAKHSGVSPDILESVQNINQTMPSYFAEQVLSTSGSGNIGILGLSFKPCSDDVRESPAASIITAILNKGYRKIYAYDPVANANFKKAYDFKINYCGSINEVCEGAKTVMIVTAWAEFKGVDKLYPNVKFIDGRYIL